MACQISEQAEWCSNGLREPPLGFAKALHNTEVSVESIYCSQYVYESIHQHIRPSFKILPTLVPDNALWRADSHPAIFVLNLEPLTEKEKKGSSDVFSINLFPTLRIAYGLTEVCDGNQSTPWCDSQATAV